MARQTRGQSMKQNLKGDYPTDDFDAEMIAIIDAEIEQYDAAVAYEPSAKLYGPTTDMPWWIWKRVKEAILRQGAFRTIVAAGWDECLKTIEPYAHIDWCVKEIPQIPFKIDDNCTTPATPRYV